MRTFSNRTVEMATTGARAGGVIVNNYGNAVNETGKRAKGTTGAFNSLSRANITLMEGFRRHVAQITALRTLVYQAAFWFGPLVYGIIKVNAEYERQMQLLKNLSGQSSEVAKTQWANQTREQLAMLAMTNPYSLHSITDAFVKMKTVGLDPLNGQLQTLMDSLAAFGRDDQSLRNATLAIQEMVGKTSVSMKELRRQLGQYIPDAMKSMAEGMGMSMKDFYKAVQTGTIESREAIKKMLAVLDLAHRGAANNMMMTWTGLFARLTTTWQLFVAKLEHPPNGGRDSFIGQMKKDVNDLMVFLNSPAGVNFAISVDQGLASVARGLEEIIKFVLEWKDQIVFAAKTFALLWGGKLVLGVLTSLISVFTAGFRLMLLATNALTGVMGSAAAAQGVFAGAVRSTAVALGVCATAEEAATLGIGALAGAMGLALGVAVALAGAIWIVVAALNAQTNAQKNSDLAKRAARGNAWQEDENGNSTDRDATKKRLLATKADADFYRKGGYRVNAEGQPEYIPPNPAKANQLEAEYNKGAHAYNAMNANTANARVKMENVAFEQSQPDPYAGIRSKYNNLKYPIGKDGQAGAVDPKKFAQLDTAEAHEMAGAAQMDIWRLQKMKKGATPAMQAAIDQQIEKRQGDIDSFINKDAKSINEPNAFVKGDKKKKKKKGARNPLEGTENAFTNTYVQTADLQHQYDDLVNGTSTEFNGEAARAEGERISKLYKTKDALRMAMQAEKDRQEELKKSIKVEQAIKDVQDKRSKTDDEIRKGLDDLRSNYISVTTEANNYRGELEREKRSELEIAEARMASGKATADNIRQYIELKQAIYDAVRAKQAELVVEAAKDAKQSNEEYYATFRSPGQQADYQAGLDRARYSNALDNAIRLSKTYNNVDHDLAQAKAELNRLTEEGTHKETDEIIVTTQRRVQLDEENKAAIESIPYLQERLRIIDQETEARKKWSGAGGPLFDWAKKAAADFNNLGESMGNVLTGAMDDFISSLADGKMAFADFAKTVLKQLLLIIIRGLIARAIMSALGLSGWGGGQYSSSAGMDFSGAGSGLDFGTSFSGAGMGFGHKGMIAGGSPTFTRNVNPAMFAFARRYHTGGIVGLGSDEVPIVAQKGEGIFTKDQMEALGQSSKGSNVQVNVINQTGVQADAERKPPKFDGEKWVETIILKKVSTAGPVRDALTAAVKRN
jgi:tape measure domain-containing protein